MLNVGRHPDLEQNEAGKPAALGLLSRAAQDDKRVEELDDSPGSQPVISNAIRHPLTDEEVETKRRVSYLSLSVYLRIRTGDNARPAWSSDSVKRQVPIG